VTYIFLRESDSQDTLMFVCDQRDTAEFADWLMRRGSKIGEVTKLDSDNGFEPRNNVLAFLDVETDGAGLASVTQSGNQTIVTWHISPNGCVEAAKAVGALSSAATGVGHQYLEQAGNVWIKVSMNEWKDSVWKENLRKAVGRE